MKRISLILLAALLVCGSVALSGCDSSDYAASDQIIIDAKTLNNYVGKENIVIVDMQDAEGYAGSHVSGAVNIPVSSVLVNLPVDNMLAPKGKVSSAMGEAGIDNNTMVVIYDEGKSLNASRLWWTLLVYGHDNVKVVSGGLPAIKAANVQLTADFPQVTPKEFTITEDRREQYVVDMSDVLEHLDNPNPNVVLLDTRTNEEYLESGKIPDSIMYSHTKNFYSDGTFINTQAARINYIEQGIRAETEVITYCKTSMRAAATFLRLYDAGYRNLKIYDGAYLEWSKSGANPTEMPLGAVAASPRDNS